MPITDNGIIDAKVWAEKRLITAFPTLKISFENKDFTAPNKELYLATQFVINTPVDPVWPAGYHREDIQFQVFVMDVLNVGTGSGYSKALQIRDLFKKGTTANQFDSRIYVLETPHIVGSTRVQSHMTYPILISLTVEVGFTN